MNKKSILFLGYDEKKTFLIEELKSKGCNLELSNKKIFQHESFDKIILFGYRYLIKEDLLESINIPIINLHISYLPWNRGAHPNFWSFYEESPCGVTIHLVDKGIDTGPILYQKQVFFDKNERTFRETYNRLINEIEQLFIKNIDEIIDGNFIIKSQKGIGSFHKKNELPKEFLGWDSNINDEIARLKKIYE